MQRRRSEPFPQQPFRAMRNGSGETMPSEDTTGSATVQPRRFTYSLGQAARAVGKAKSTLSRDVRAVFASVWKRVTAMVEPAACVGRGDAVEGGGEGSFERVGGARLDSAQDALELGPAGFDGRKIG